MDMMHIMDPDMMTGPMMGWWLLTWLLFLAILVVGVVLLVRFLVRSAGGGRPASSALHILEERFARGEIDREEFEERKRTLQS